MAKVQAFVLTCNEESIQKELSGFLENQLNLYAVVLNTLAGGVLEIFNHSPKENELFDKIQSAIDDHQIDRIILINHAKCSAYDNNEANTHEIHLRHAVSTVKAKFANIDVEAYLLQDHEFKKVV